MKLRYLMIFFLLMAASPYAALATSYDIKNMTPEIEKALSGRQARYAQLNLFKSTGCLGENNLGLVEVLDNPSVCQPPALAENRDRMVIYRAIADQNNLGSEGLAQVQNVFGEVQRERASSGDPVQLPSGEWIKK